MLQRFQSATIKTRLMLFAGGAVVSMLTLVGSYRLASQRIDPAVLRAHGFTWEQPGIRAMIEAARQR